MKLRVGVLVSGSGTNLGALLEAARAPQFPAEIALVISNIAGVGALERAKAARVPSQVHKHADYASRAEYDVALRDALLAAHIDLVCLAGFMRLLGPDFLSAFPDRVINIHPALLPAFPGLHGPRQALAYGVKVAGCTVHFVDGGTDTGPIIAQVAVPVLASDDEDALRTRILAEEHQLYPRVVAWMAEGRVRRSGRHVHVDAPPPDGKSLRVP